MLPGAAAACWPRTPVLRTVGLFKVMFRFLQHGRSNRGEVKKNRAVEELAWCFHTLPTVPH